MPLRTSAGLSSAWMGFTLASLFLYPLASVLSGNIYYLQWQPRHLAETLVALAILTAAFGLAWAAAERLDGLAGAVALCVVASVPLLSLAVGVAGQIPVRGTLVPLWEIRGVRYGVPLAAAATVLAALVAMPTRVARAIKATVSILSPVGLLAVATIAFTARYAPPTIVIATAATGGTASSAGCRSVLAFLFDELSFSYLYEGGAVRREFGAIRRFADGATNHMAVAAPGRETLASLPGFLASRPLDNVVIEDDRVLEVRKSGQVVPFDGTAPTGLFGTARRLGFRTELAGYYLAYCDLLEPVLDACESYSFYNTASVRPSFSALNPMLTTLVLWPRQFPFGLLKNPPFARQQEGLVARTLPFAAAPLAAGRPVFRFVHFSVPHLPFAFSEQGFAPPLDPLRTSPDDAYVRQLAFVDRLFGNLWQRLEADPRFPDTTVVLLSDHGFRFGGRERDPLHVPFIVRHAGQQGRVDVTTPERAEALLRDTLVDACK
jgi:Sulfatase